MSTQQLGIAPAVAIAAIGPIITKAKDIISKVAPILQNVFSSRATRALKAQKGEYDAANNQLRTDITQINNALQQLQAQGNAISQQMRQYGINGLAGLDGDLGNIFRKIADAVTGKTRATRQLNSAQAEYQRLSTERDQKLTAANEMVQQLDTLQKKLQDAIAAQSSILPGISNRTLLIGGAAVGIATLVAVAVSRKNKPATKK